MAGGSHRGDRSVLGLHVVTGDSQVVGKFWETGELRRTPLSSTVASAEVGVALGSGLSSIWRPPVQRSFEATAAAPIDELGGSWHRSIRVAQRR